MTQIDSINQELDSAAWGLAAMVRLCKTPVDGLLDLTDDAVLIGDNGPVTFTEAHPMGSLVPRDLTHLIELRDMVIDESIVARAMYDADLADTVRPGSR